MYKKVIFGLQSSDSKNKNPSPKTKHQNTPPSTKAHFSSYFQHFHQLRPPPRFPAGRQTEHKYILNLQVRYYVTRRWSADARRRPDARTPRKVPVASGTPRAPRRPDGAPRIARTRPQLRDRDGQRFVPLPLVVFRNFERFLALTRRNRWNFEETRSQTFRSNAICHLQGFRLIISFKLRNLIWKNFWSDWFFRFKKSVDLTFLGSSFGI